MSKDARAAMPSIVSAGVDVPVRATSAFAALKDYAKLLLVILQRNVGAGIGAVLMITLIIGGMYHALYFSLDRSIHHDLRSHATQLGTQFAQEPVQADAFVRTGSPTEAQTAFIQNFLAFDASAGFQLYDPEGRSAFAAGASRPRQDLPPAGPLVQQTIFERQPITRIHHLRERGVHPLVLVESFAPIYGENGEVLGVASFHSDRTRSYYQTFDNFEYIAFLLPLLFSCAFAIPAIAYLVKAEQADRRNAQVERLSHFDPLTAVLNRATFLEECQALFGHRLSQWRDFAVFFIDVDRFKQVNDEYGHEFGDQFLKHVANAISAGTHPKSLVGRMGGDEFIVVVPHIYQGTMLTMAERILKAASVPCEHKGRTIIGSVSIGAHLSPPGESQERAFHSADLALYNAKYLGRNRVVEYKEALDHAIQRRRAIEARMRIALNEDLFEVAYHPLTTAKTAVVAGFEALLRLSFEDGTPIGPAEFIPIAEETGMIHEIGMVVLEKAIKVAKGWPETIFLSVNLSPVQFEGCDLVGKIASVLEKTGFPANRLEVEVTESLILREGGEIADQLRGLKELGLSIAMDDFGTGYSSLAYLWQYSFDKLKVDRGFLLGFRTDPQKHRDVIETIVLLGHKLGMEVAVEGVELAEHAEMLSSMGCDQLQGFLYGEPMSGADTHKCIAAAEAFEVSSSMTSEASLSALRDQPTARRENRSRATATSV